MVDENMAVNSAETPSTPESGTEQTPQTEVTPSAPIQEPTFTKSQVIDMMKKRVGRSHNAFFNRYGVKDLAEMDGKFNKLKEYEEQLLGLQGKNAELGQMNAFLRNNVNPSKYDDIKTYFKGLGEDFSEERLLDLIKTHPDWLTKIEEPKFNTTITSLSPDRGSKIQETEDEKMKRVFGI